VKVVRYFLRRYPWQSFGVLLCLVTAGATEGVGLTALLPLLSAVAPGEADAAATPSALEVAVNDFMARYGLDPTLGELLAFLIIVFWLKALVVLLAKRQVGYMVARVATDLRFELLRSLMNARWSHYTRLPAGSASNALATEAERASLTYHHISQVAGHLVEAIVYLGLALAISWQVTLGAMAAAAFTLGSLSALVRMSGQAGRKQTKSLKALLSRMTDSLQAAKLLKSTGREQLIFSLIENEVRRMNTALRRRIFSKEALRALQEPIIITAGGVGLFVALEILGYPFAETALMTGLFLRTISSSNKMQRKYQAMWTEASALDSLRGMIDRAQADVEQRPGRETPTLERGIELRDVNLRYEGDDLMRSFSLEIPAGRITALVGDSGVGKTTVADLVTGLTRPDSGQVLVDGVNLDEIDLLKWRHLVGYVPQEMLMLHDTVARNVSLGDAAIDDTDIESALRDAGAWDFVSALPGGLDASVGERGSLLSGGQRQRIAIARALVHGAKLLILDEATAALDPQSEAGVWSAVQRLRGRTTVLAISHQPALTGVADRIYRMRAGTVVRESAANGQRAVG